MADLFRARDTVLERDVAIKVLRADAGDLRRFQAETSMLAELAHPNLVRLFDAGSLAPAGQPHRGLRHR